MILDKKHLNLLGNHNIYKYLLYPISLFHILGNLLTFSTPTNIYFGRIYISIITELNTLAKYNSDTGVIEWFSFIKKNVVETSSEVRDFFDLLKTSPDFKISDTQTFLELSNGIGDSDKTFQSFIKTTKESNIAYKTSEEAMAGYQAYLNSTSTALSVASVKTKVLSTSMKLLSSIGWMAAFTAATWAIGKGIEAIGDYVHRLDKAKETLANTESDLSSVKSEIETTTEQIKKLEAMDSLSITDEEDLQRLKDQNEELRIRQQYLEKQKQIDTEKVANYTKEKYNSQYTNKSGSIQDDIDKYRDLYGQTQNQSSYASANGSSGIPGSMSYAPAVTANEYNIESESLANLIAQYQYYKEEKAKAISSKDTDGIEKYNAKLEETSQKLMDNRTTLQGFSDDLSGEASPELDGITEKLKLIDELLLMPGQKLVSFINSDALKDDKEKLVALADSGKLTAKVLSDNFSNVDDYLKENGLTIGDLISVIKTYKDEFATTGEAIKKSLSKEEVIANINTLSEGFESLDKIMKSISDKDNPFDYALLDDKKFKEKFSGLGKSYTDFIEKISSSPKDIKATQSAFDELVTIWIDSSGVLDGLTTDNANLATGMLQNMGVANAEEVVMSRLSIAQEHLAAEKAFTAEKSDELSNAMANEIPGLINEATQSDIAKVALAGLALEKANANGTTLDTSGDIENVTSLIGVIGTATTALRAYNKIKAGEVFDSETQKSNRDKLFSQNTGLGLVTELDNQLKAYKEKVDSTKSDAEKEIQDAINASKNYKGKGTNINASYGGGVKTNKSSASGSKKDKKDTTKDFDWIDRELQLLEKKRSNLKESASNTYIDYLGITNEEFDKAKEILSSQAISTTQQIDELSRMAKKAGLSLGELYTLINQGTPGESRANYLSQILEVDKTMLEKYSQAVQQYQSEYEQAMSKISPVYRIKIEGGMSFDDMSIETLSSDESEKVQDAINKRDKLTDSMKKQSDMEKKYIEDTIAPYENKSAAIDNLNKQLENQNSLLEKQIDYYKSAGEIVDSSFYENLIKNTKEEIANTRGLLANKREELNKLHENPNISKNSEEYIKLKSEISDTEVALYALKKAQEEYNEQIKRIPIDNLSTVISMYKDINDTISNWGAEIEASGKKLDTNYYQTMISNGTTIIDQYKEQASLIEDLMGEYETGSDNWNELYGQLRNVNSEMSSMVQNLRKWNEELLKMPLEKISSYTSELQKVVDGLSAIKSDYDTTISAVTGAIKEQIDAINEQKNSVNKEYDAQKKALQDKLDLLNKQNKELQLQQKYEQALYDLQRANQQATEKVIRDGQVVYEQNADKLRQAQEAVQDAKFDMETNKIQTQIDDLQETLDGLNEKYQDQIDSLQKISDKWSEISEKITQAQNEAKADELLGIGWKDKVLSGKDLELFNNFSGMYANTAEQLKKYQDQINTTNNIYSLLEDYIASYKEGTLSYDQALNGINDLLSQMNKTMSADGNLQNIYDYLGAMNGTAANAENVLAGIQQGLSNSATELLESFKQYNQNAGMISEYTSSWQQLTNNVSSMLEVLKEVRDNLEDAYDSSDDNSDDDNGDPFRKGSEGYVNSGPGVKAFKKGIENGLVGTSSTSDREAKMKLIGLKDLERDEVLALLHKNEAVFNPEQQNTLLSNLSRAWSYTPPKIPDYSNMLTNRSNITTQEFKFGDINIQECDDTNGLVQGILNGGFKSAFIQQLGKR